MKKVTLGLILVPASIALLIGFQNCANKTGFNSTGELVAKTSTDSSTDSTGSLNTGDGVPSGSTPPTPGTAPTSGTPPSTGTSGSTDASNGGSHTTPRVGNPKAPCPPDNGHETVTADPNESRNFVCVLRGHGKSVKIGLADKILQGQVGTPRDVCMTEHACLSILSRKFDVQGAERRGFCPDKNPNVIAMTDVEIESALAHAELIKSAPVAATK